MIAMMRERLNKEEGFTLVELMVVVLIIAILIAIAIPTFLGARERAQDRAAQSNLRNALTAQKVYYTDAENYTADGAALNAIEPSLTFAGAPDVTNNTVIGTAVCDADDGTTTVADGAVALTSVSSNGVYWTIIDVAATTAAGTYYFGDTAVVACDGAGGGGAEDGFPAAP